MKKKSITVVILSVFLPLLAFANEDWEKFDCSAGDSYTYKFENFNISIKPSQTKIRSSFTYDDLILSIYREDETDDIYYFTSSYGHGKIRKIGNYLFLEYGKGRGTRVRTKHIKILDISNTIIEIVDFQMSFWVPERIPPLLNDVGPWNVEYEMEIMNDNKYLIINIIPKEKGYNLPKKRKIQIEKNG